MVIECVYAISDTVKRQRHKQTIRRSLFVALAADVVWHVVEEANKSRNSGSAQTLSHKPAK
jgi:hypothetical protein